MLLSVLQIFLLASSVYQNTAYALKLNLPSDHGNITSPNYPLNYGDGMNNRYLIVAPPGYIISFKFHLLELEDKDKNGEDTDVLKIIDGKKSQVRVRMFLSGNLSTPFHIISKTNQVRVIFISNRNGITFKGFHITYQAYKKETSCTNVATFKFCQTPNVPSSQCIGGCVNDLTLIPYNYSTSCNNGIFAPFACVDTKEIERCEVDVNYTECAYTTDEMMRIFETLTFEEDVDVTEDDNDVDDEDDDDFDYDLGRSIGISKKCRKFCKRHRAHPDVWNKPRKCSKLTKKKKWSTKDHINQQRTCMACRPDGCRQEYTGK